ncbi:hypothetical protein A6J45_013150 [Neisseria gonorrhoeae]|nr:hypothetical protein A6J45_013150 [Neisseria gonorrhoeae]
MKKGKQLGDKTSTWTRFEIEFKAKDIVIPFEVLPESGRIFRRRISHLRTIRPKGNAHTRG